VTIVWLLRFHGKMVYPIFIFSAEAREDRS
jgi:hypothetical protein